jgi:hypothetical protein
MRKLRIDLRDLRVESFVAGKDTPARGTVRAHQSGYPCPQETDFDFHTCGDSCINMCINTLQYLSCHCG